MQLEFQIINNAGGTPTPNVIFITDDPTYNKVSLQIYLTSGSTTLLPGTIPDPMSPPTVGTTLYVDLSSLQLSSKAWDQLTFTAAGAGWAFKKFAHSVLGMTPTHSIALKSGNSNNISIGIGGIVVSLPLAPPVLFYVMYYNVPNVVGQTSSFQVAIQNPPVGTNKLSDDIQVALYPSDGTIVNSVLPKLEALNRFSLQFSSRQEVQVEAGADTVFTVSFVYGKPGDKNGFGALTDVTHATQINTDGSNAERWTITLDGSAQSPYWTLQPPAGAPIVGTGEGAVVAIEFSNVVTTYQPGPTAMLIQYSGVPGYQDGTFELVLNKVAHAVIHTFDVVPEYSSLSDDGTANVTVRWSASDAVSLELTQAGQGPIPVTGMSQVPAVIEAAKTVFTLKATGAAGTVENADSKHVTAFALPPVICEFSGSITTKHNGRLSLQLTWSTKGAAAVSISGNRSPIDRSGSLTITPTRQKPLRANYILTAMNAAGKTTATVTIGNWKPTSLKSVPDLQRIAITPDGTRIFTSSGFPSNGCLSVFDAFTLALAAQPIQIPYIYGLDVSPDGKLVAACEIGLFSEANVYLFDAETLAPARGSPKKVPVPTTLKFSPDSNQLYVVNNAGTFGPGTLTVLFAVQLKPIQGSPFNLASMFNPGDLAFSPGGDFVYIVNGDQMDGTLIVLDSDMFQPVAESPIHVGDAPFPVAASPDGRVFVGNTGDSTITILDASLKPVPGSPLHSPSPGAMVFTLDGSTLFVSNQSRTWVSIFDTDKLQQVSGAPVQVCENPSQGVGGGGMAVSSDGTRVFVATGQGIAVLTPSASGGVPAGSVLDCST